MTNRHHARLALLTPLVASGLALAGCMSSPTYGTDKTANEQLVGDLSNAFSLAPKNGNSIDYKPRPALVKPAPGQKEALPAPQDSITQTAADQWPESPEQKRARLRGEATANRDDPNFQPQIVDDTNDGSRVPALQAAESSDNGHEIGWTHRKALEDGAKFRQQLAATKQGDPTSRRYLSEPPLTYRAAAATAPQGELGEDEYKKERRLKRESSVKKGKFDWWPW
ncbi:MULTISPECIES: hypothetical protein [unclassified Mesorhizobium]|uniref:hypothetical protein n=1 Tax=unclassified Mesorhizobium TaxID=325217 RepID=UPI000AA68EA3|nr:MULTISPECIES: hypothetical protein [unclassified Mesorhizobium]MDR7032699.1 hypothetical protein [Mesorhizobium sp. BE184]